MRDEQISITTLTDIRAVTETLKRYYMDTGYNGFLYLSLVVASLHDRLSREANNRTYQREWRIEKIKRKENTYFVLRSGKRGNIRTIYVGKEEKLAEFLKNNPDLLLYGKLAQDIKMIEK